MARGVSEKTSASYPFSLLPSHSATRFLLSLWQLGIPQNHKGSNYVSMDVVRKISRVGERLA